MVRAAWPALAQQCADWAEAQGVVLRDCIVLLPFAQLLPLAQQAFAARGGWQPRLETTQTLARALGPAAVPAPTQLCGDAAIDRLTADQLLRAQSVGAQWARHDPRGFDRGVAMLVETARALVQAAAAVAPDRRADWWHSARGVLAPVPAQGARERWLARIALEWAAQAPDPATDRLYRHRPGAWLAVQAGGSDTFVESLFAGAAAQGTPCLVIDADAPDETLWPPGAAAPALAVCHGFEDEAQCAAAEVLANLAAGRRQVALVGQDRLLVRRVRALLERAGVQPQDETGWTLSTTRAAAQLMLLLRAAAPRARTDDLFDWLKTLPSGGTDAVERLEQACRRLGLARVDQLDGLPPGSPEAEAWSVWRSTLDRLRDQRRPLAVWLRLLGDALEACGAGAALRADEAGRAVLQAVRLDDRALDQPLWRETAERSVMDLAELTAWVDEAVEEASFQPASGNASVVVTPMARLALRPFEAVVWPGADDRHLGAPPAPHPLLGEALLRALGLPDAGQRRLRERQLFAQAMRLPGLTFLRRRVDEDEPLGDSPLVQRIRLELAEAGRPLAPWVDPRRVVELRPTPVARPAPALLAALPARLSASAADALRDCPYRFFVRHLLRLREDEELDDEVEKRDYGTWLHAILYRFHAERVPGDAEAETARLLALAEDEREAQGLSQESALPFAASLASLAPRYVAWLHARDADGWVWRAGEQERRRPLPALPQVELQGVIDRVDRGADGRVELIDYKTGSVDGLRRKLRRPLEDTQLAFYAALVDEGEPAPLQAAYLPLDGSKALLPLPHPQVRDSAAALLAGLGGEMLRIRDGAPLPALGEGSTCDFCEARGLCRRDHWSGV
ncbi:MAG: PD-(D/E)XK nuclease family protein [Piscinibacter sp.]|nr:PD-(D/E)XK nuclease family protein [Piscinibacter sp.]